MLRDPWGVFVVRAGFVVVAEGDWELREACEDVCEDCSGFKLGRCVS